MNNQTEVIIYTLDVPEALIVESYRALTTNNAKYSVLSYAMELERRFIQYLSYISVSDRNQSQQGATDRRTDETHSQQKSPKNKPRRNWFFNKKR